MITVKLLGGLGNQMFQYAYGMALKERGYQVRYDRSALIEGAHREYSLGYFGIEADGVEDSPRYFEGGAAFNEHHLNPSAPRTMVGYWQSEKYFADIADKVREAFSFKWMLPRQAFSFKWMLPRQVQTIALHVRRADYVKLQHFHGMPGLDYYREAVALIRRRAGFNCYVLVFSDDHAWCHDNFPSDFQIIGAGDKYQDLALMASCDYQVIANSSFSWWGAWLGPQKIVVAPQKWFVDPSMDYSDIVPERWVKL